MLNTEFFNAAASRFDNFAARLSALALFGTVTSGERRNGAADKTFLLGMDADGADCCRAAVMRKRDEKIAKWTSEFIAIF